VETFFADLERPDAEEAFARARLAQLIAQIIARKALSQTVAANLDACAPV
jgi:predicted XRE-type DNA-binding protein